MESYQGLQLLFRHCTGLLVSDVCAAICLEESDRGKFYLIELFSINRKAHIGFEKILEMIVWKGTF